MVFVALKSMVENINIHFILKIYYYPIRVCKGMLTFAKVLTTMNKYGKVLNSIKKNAEVCKILLKAAKVLRSMQKYLKNGKEKKKKKSCKDMHKYAKLYIS